MIHTYPPLNLEVRTQRLTLAGATDGHGIGAEMRAAVLHLASAGLGVREATSDAFTDNHAQPRVPGGPASPHGCAASSGRSAGFWP
jgi:hypothetical protein